MAPITRSQRYRRIATVVVEEGFGTALDQVGVRAPWLASIRGRRSQLDEGLSPEQRLRVTMERLGPTFAKIGQMLSVRPDLIPPSFADELAKLQDEMRPFAFEQVREQIERAFGETVEEIFAEFDPVPKAAATIGQVHMAVLKDGKPVAVKVQRPDIREVIAADLDILRTQAHQVQGRTEIGRRYDLVGLVDEFARVLEEECDYIREGQNADRLRVMFPDDDRVCFPRVFWEHTSATVLTLERLEGIPFNRLDELDAAGIDRHEIARKGIVCYYEQIFLHGFYHADPHPGNLFAMPDGRVAFADFGRCGTLSEDARNHVADLLVAIIEQDGDLATDILLDVSGGAGDIDVVGLRRDVTTLIAKYYDMRLHEVDARELIVEIMSLIGQRGLVLASEFALLLTTFATLQALGTAVDPQFHFVESVRPFAKRIVEKQMSPDAMAKSVVSTARRAMRGMQGLPENVNRALKRVGDGDLRMTVRPGGYDSLMSRIEQAVDRIAFAVVVSAFVLGFSWLLASPGVPPWLELIASFALVCAAGVGIWFFLSMVWRRFRWRGRE